MHHVLGVAFDFIFFPGFSLFGLSRFGSGLFKIPRDLIVRVWAVLFLWIDWFPWFLGSNWNLSGEQENLDFGLCVCVMFLLSTAEKGQIKSRNKVFGIFFSLWRNAFVMKWIFWMCERFWPWDLGFIDNKRDLCYILHLFLCFTSFSFQFGFFFLTSTHFSFLLSKVS